MAPVVDWPFSVDLLSEMPFNHTVQLPLPADLSWWPSAASRESRQFRSSPKCIGVCGDIASASVSAVALFITLLTLVAAKCLLPVLFKFCWVLIVRDCIFVSTCRMFHVTWTPSHCKFNCLLEIYDFKLASLQPVLFFCIFVVLPVEKFASFLVPFIWIMKQRKNNQ